MADKLSILIVDDSPADVTLLQRRLKKAEMDFEVIHVDNADDMRSALSQETIPDVVISDCHMPGFGAEAALNLWRELGHDIPFIVVSGAIGEEEAVDLMKHGAHDFVRKDNLARLIPAIQREIHEAQQRAERRAVEQRLRQAATIFENTAEGVVITDAHGKLININPAFTNITGYQANEVIGKNSRFIRSKRHDRQFYRVIWNTLKEEGHWQGEVWSKHKSGKIHPAWLAISVVHDEQERILNYIGAITDISAIKRSEEKLAYMAQYDTLTKLPNRMLFNDRLEHALQRSHREKTMVGVVFLDLDRFKNINDSMGHLSGDLLLQMVARRLLTVVREGDTVARLGGDEFILIIENLTSTSAVARVAQKLLTLFHYPYHIEKKDVFVSASIGISLSPNDGKDVTSLLKNADVAMYQAKAQGRNTYQFYTSDMNEHALETLILESDLRKALEQDEFEIHYQPQFELNSKKLIGVEALLRWQHPEKGLLPPGTFIPIAEDIGLIVPVGEWTLRTVCAQSKAWQRQGYPPVRIAVNLSTRHFRQTNLANHVAQLLESTQLSPQYLELEITESMLMENVEATLKMMHELTNMGITLSIDDFGTGYSSLSYLKRFPISKLKIDQSFVRDITTDSNDAAIVAAIIAMGQNMKLRVIAEGVENQGQLEFLKQQGCLEAQGFFFEKPLPAAEFEKFLKNQ